MIINGFDYEVDLHRFDMPPLDITEMTGAVTWSHNTTGSSGAAITLRVPMRLWGNTVPFAVGSWVTIRARKTREVAWWGRVVTVSSGLTVGISGPPHEVATQGVDLVCESFLGILSRAQIVLAPGVNFTAEGLYSLKSWFPAMKGWMGSMRSKKPGELLETIFRALATIRLPGSLGGEPLGEAVPVAWQAASSPLRLRGRHIDVEGFSLQAFKNAIPRGTVWGMISGTFQLDPGLLELFPGVYPGEARTGLEKVLGAQARLIYRMAPLHPTRACSGPNSRQTGLFQDVPTNKVSVFRSQDVYDMSLTWNDNDRVNCFHLQTPISNGSQMPRYGLIGEPIVDIEDAARHGLRLFEPSWPFFPRAENATMLQYVDALIEYSAHIHNGRANLATGNIALRPRPGLRPGVWAAVELRAGTVLYCYVRSVSHSAQVDPESGRSTEHTNIQFTHGSFEADRPPTPKTSLVGGSVIDLEIAVSRGRGLA